MTSYLGLDIATDSGWCIITDLGGGRFKYRCGTISLKSNHGINDKCIRLAQGLARLLNSERRAGTQLVGASIEEALMYVSGRTTRSVEKTLYGEVITEKQSGASSAQTIAHQNKLNGVAICACVGFRLFPHVVRADDWRKHFINACRTPKGEAKDWIKTEVIKRAETLGAVVNSDNEGDACGIADHGFAQWRLAQKNQRVAA